MASTLSGQGDSPTEAEIITKKRKGYNTHYRGDILSAEELATLERCETAVNDYIARLADAGTALEDILRLGLWRCSSPTWKHYIQTRWKMTMRMAQYIMNHRMMEAGAINDIARNDPKHPLHVSQMDVLDRAMDDTMRAKGNTTAFFVSLILNNLRSVREILIANLLPVHSKRMDYRQWLLDLQKLAVTFKDAFTYDRDKYPINPKPKPEFDERGERPDYYNRNRNIDHSTAALDGDGMEE